jgi:hypothetical protein
MASTERVTLIYTDRKRLPKSPKLPKIAEIENQESAGIAVIARHQKNKTSPRIDTDDTGHEEIAKIAGHRKRKVLLRASVSPW